MVRNVVKNRITQNQISFEVMVLEKKKHKRVVKGAANPRVVALGRDDPRSEK